MQQGLLDEALTLFETMQKSLVAPNIVIYNILIDGMCKVGKIKDAGELFSRAFVEGLQPSVWTFTIIINGL